MERFDKMLKALDILIRDVKQELTYLKTIKIKDGEYYRDLVARGEYYVLDGLKDFMDDLLEEEASVFPDRESLLAEYVEYVTNAIRWLDEVSYVFSNDEDDGEDFDDDSINTNGHDW